MQFGIREVCDCAFMSLDGKGLNFKINTAKMTTLESTSTTVYAQGGRGFSRLAAWEGEKTLTFTVEDALLSTESFQALLGKTGATSTVAGHKRYTMTTTDYAGYYQVTAQTLWRNVEDGSDHAAIITIPKAKLQSNISISMAPNGDPSAFTFTFDAFAKNGELCYIDVADEDINHIEEDGKTTTAIIYYKEGTEPIRKASTAASMSIGTDGKITVGSEEINVTLAENEELTNMVQSYSIGDETVTINLEAGSTTYWYVI